MSHTLSASARAKAAARKAILEAEAIMLRWLHQIEEEELKLRQCKTKLRFKTELAKAEAEELVYAQAQEREIAASYFPRDEPQATISTDPAPAPNVIEMNVKEDKVTPIAEAIESENLPEQSTPLNPTAPSVAKPEKPTRQLNPEALVWQKKQVKEPTPGQTSVPLANSVTPPKGDIQLLFHQHAEIPPQMVQCPRSKI